MGAVLAPDDELGDHRVVMRRDRIALADAAVDAHRCRLPVGIGADRELDCSRRTQMHQRAGRGQKSAVRVLGIDPHFNCMATRGERVLQAGQPLAAGHAQLPLDQIQASDHFGDRMLDLQAGVHLHEVEGAAGIHDEFDRAGADIADRARRRHRCLAHGAALDLAQPGGRGFFDHFLMASLHRAVALEEIDGVAVRVGKDLDFNVAGAGGVFLDQYRIVAETGSGFAPARGEHRCEFTGFAHDAHALSAAAGTGLDQHRKADAIGFALKQGIVLIGIVIARNQRHAGLRHQPLRFGFEAHGGDGRGRRADEDQPVVLTGLGKGGVFRQKTIARMNRLRAASQGRLDDRVTAQIGLACRRRTDPDRFVAGARMAGVGIGIRVDRDRANAEPAGSGGNAAGDFATIGDQDLVEHGP